MRGELLTIHERGVGNIVNRAATPVIAMGIEELAGISQAIVESIEPGSLVSRELADRWLRQYVEAIIEKRHFYGV